MLYKNGPNGITFLPLNAVFFQDKKDYVIGPIKTSDGRQYALKALRGESHANEKGTNRDLCGYARFILMPYRDDLNSISLESTDDNLFGFECEMYKECEKGIYCYAMYFHGQGSGGDYSYHDITKFLKFPKPSWKSKINYGLYGEGDYIPDLGFILNFLLNMVGKDEFNWKNNIQLDSVKTLIKNIGGFNEPFIQKRKYDNFKFFSTTTFEVGIWPNNIEFPQRLKTIDLSRMKGGEGELQILSYDGFPEYGIIVGPILVYDYVVEEWIKGRENVYIHMFKDEKKQKQKQIQIKAIKRSLFTAEESVWSSAYGEAKKDVELSKIQRKGECIESLYDRGTEGGTLTDDLFLIDLFENYVDLENLVNVLKEIFISEHKRQNNKEDVGKGVFFPQPKIEKTKIYFSESDSTISTRKIYSQDNSHAGVVLGKFLLNSHEHGLGDYCLHISGLNSTPHLLRVTLDQESSPEQMFARVQKMNFTGQSAFSEKAISVSLSKKDNSCEVEIVSSGKVVLSGSIKSDFFYGSSTLDIHGDSFIKRKQKKAGIGYQKYKVFSPDYGTLLNLLPSVGHDEIAANFSPAMLFVDAKMGGGSGFLFSQSTRDFVRVPHYRSRLARTVIHPIKVIRRELWNEKFISVALVSIAVSVAYAYQQDPEGVEQLAHFWLDMLPGGDSVMSGLTQTFQSLGICPVVDEESCSSVIARPMESEATGWKWW